MICPRCHRNRACERPSCPLKARESFAKNTNFSYKKDFTGSTPNVFVGRFGYPNVNVGLLSTDFSQDDVDDPLRWSREKYEMNRIVNLRSTLVNSRFASSIHSPTSRTKNKLQELSKEISLSAKKVDTEVHLKKKPMPGTAFNKEATPHGPSVPVESAEAAENIRVPTKVDKAVSDEGYKAGSALKDLYKHNFDEHYLTKVLSVGNLGVQSQRKMVPTRWSITAVDDTLGKGMLEKIKDFSATLEPTAFYGGYLGNYFLALFFPGRWSFEFIENYTFDMEKDNPSEGVGTDSDFEGYQGRKSYAMNTAGGYYAARLPILEYMKDKRRQGSIMLLRFITKDYYASLGVWVVRESVRKTLQEKPIEFASEDLMLLYAKKLIMKRFKYDLEPVLKRSTILDTRKRQSSLDRFR